MCDSSTQEISDLIAEIYSGDCNGGFSRKSLETIATRFSSSRAALVRNSNSNERDRVFACVGYDESRLREMIAGGRSWMQFLDVNEFPSGRAFTRVDLPGEKGERLRDRFHYSRKGRKTLVGMVASGPSHQALVWFSRDSEAGDYSQAEKNELELFLPHFSQATRLSDEFTDLHMQLDTANQVLNRTPFGMFFLDVNGELLYGNDRARQMLELKDGLKILDGKLTPHFDDERKQFDKFLKDFRSCADSDGLTRQRLTVRRSNGESPYLMMFIPMRIQPNSGRRHGGRIILLQVHNPAGIDKAKVDGLEKFYNLTFAEAEVCQRLYQRKCLSGVAEDLGVSVNTAKTHLIRSFRKIGVSSQAELLQQLAAHPKHGW